MANNIGPARDGSSLWKTGPCITDLHPMCATKEEVRAQYGYNVAAEECHHWCPACGKSWSHWINGQTALGTYKKMCHNRLCELKRAQRSAGVAVSRQTRRHADVSNASDGNPQRNMARRY